MPAKVDEIPPGPEADAAPGETEQKPVIFSSPAVEAAQDEPTHQPQSADTEASLAQTEREHVVGPDEAATGQAAPADAARDEAANGEQSEDDMEPQPEQSPFSTPKGPEQRPAKESGMINFAAASVGAELSNSSPSFHNAANLLDRQKDKYAMADCSAEEKWVEVRLGSDIHVDQVAISNNERHASGVRLFRVFAGQDQGRDRWTEIGFFEAEPTREEQSFLTEHSAEARFLRLEWESHHGLEDMCTMTTLGVYGRTHTQKFEQEATQETLLLLEVEARLEEEEELLALHGHVDEHQEAVGDQDGSEAGAVAAETNEHGRGSVDAGHDRAEAPALPPIGLAVEGVGVQAATVEQLPPAAAVTTAPQPQAELQPRQDSALPPQEVGDNPAEADGSHAPIPSASVDSASTGVSKSVLPQVSGCTLSADNAAVQAADGPAIGGAAQDLVAAVPDEADAPETTSQQLEQETSSTRTASRIAESAQEPVAAGAEPLEQADSAQTSSDGLFSLVRDAGAMTEARSPSNDSIDGPPLTPVNVTGGEADHVAAPPSHTSVAVSKAVGPAAHNGSDGPAGLISSSSPSSNESQPAIQQAVSPVDLSDEAQVTQDSAGQGEFSETSVSNGALNSLQGVGAQVPQDPGATGAHEGGLTKAHEGGKSASDESHHVTPAVAVSVQNATFGAQAGRGIKQQNASSNAAGVEEVAVQAMEAPNASRPATTNDSELTRDPASRARVTPEQAQRSGLALKGRASPANTTGSAANRPPDSRVPGPGPKNATRLPGNGTKGGAPTYPPVLPLAKLRRIPSYDIQADSKKYQVQKGDSPWRPLLSRITTLQKDHLTLYKYVQRLQDTAMTELKTLHGGLQPLLGVDISAESLRQQLAGVVESQLSLIARVDGLEQEGAGRRSAQDQEAERRAGYSQGVLNGSAGDFPPPFSPLASSIAFMEALRASLEQQAGALQCSGGLCADWLGRAQADAAAAGGRRLLGYSGLNTEPTEVVGAGQRASSKTRPSSCESRGGNSSRREAGGVQGCGNQTDTAPPHTNYDGYHSYGFGSDGHGATLEAWQTQAAAVQRRLVAAIQRLSTATAAQLLDRTASSAAGGVVLVGAGSANGWQRAEVCGRLGCSERGATSGGRARREVYGRRKGDRSSRRTGGAAADSDWSVDHSSSQDDPKEYAVARAEPAAQPAKAQAMQGAVSFVFNEVYRLNEEMGGLQRELEAARAAASAAQERVGRLEHWLLVGVCVLGGVLLGLAVVGIVAAVRSCAQPTVQYMVPPGFGMGMGVGWGGQVSPAQAPPGGGVPSVSPASSPGAAPQGAGAAPGMPAGALGTPVFGPVGASPGMQPVTGNLFPAGGVVGPGLLPGAGGTMFHPAMAQHAALSPQQQHWHLQQQQFGAHHRQPSVPFAPSPLQFPHQAAVSSQQTPQPAHAQVQRHEQPPQGVGSGQGFVVRSAQGAVLPQTGAPTGPQKQVPRVGELSAAVGSVGNSAGAGSVAAGGSAGGQVGSGEEGVPFSPPSLQLPGPSSAHETNPGQGGES